MNSSWSVATLTRNTKTDFCRYVAWYLEQGASQLHLYFHNPEDSNINLVEGDPRITVYRVAQALLDEINIVDSSQVTMQNYIGTHAYGRCTTEWMLRCDIDELIYFEDGKSLSELLDTFDPSQVDTVRLEMAEALNCDNTGSLLCFRKEIDEQNLAEIYGDVGELVVSRKGLIGHRKGKYLIRKGLEEIAVRTHAARYKDKFKKPREVFARRTAPVHLLHFNGGSFESWSSTLPHRMFNSSFDSVLAARLQELTTLGDAGIPEIRRIYDALYEFDTDRFQRLKQLGSGLEVDVQIDALVSKHFPGGGRLC